MPNGFHGSEDQWAHLTAPLRDVDELIEAFAQHNGLSVECDYHNWPSRALRWTSELERDVEVSLENREGQLFEVSASASIDERGARYWRHEVIKGSIPADQLPFVLPDLLKVAFERAGSWGRSDLAFATKLSKD